MKKKILSCAALAALFTGHANAASLNVDINNDTLNGEYHFSRQDADLDLAAGVLLTDDEGEVAYVTGLSQGKLGKNKHIRGGFGGRAYNLSPEQGDDIQALALSGFIGFTFPEFSDLSVRAEVHYAPSITISDDLDNLRELGLRVSYQLFENAAVYAGYRHLEIEKDEFEAEFDDGVHAGFSLSF